MTLVVLAIDALEPELVDHFDLQHVTLATHGTMDTFAYTLDEPYTPEVWATVATGLHPRDHGLNKANTSTWDNPVIDFLSNYTWVLGYEWRARLGDWAHALTGAEYTTPETDADSFLTGPGRCVHDWPGVVNTDWLHKYWETANPGEDGTASSEFKRAILGFAAQQFAWVHETIQHPATVVATHTHVLDMAGHIYSDDEPELRDCYQWVDEWVEIILDAMGPQDTMLILSDHGIVTPWSPDGDRDHGHHSFRAYSASTDTTRPHDVYDVRDWVEDHAPTDYDPGAAVDIPEEQLRELGYIE